MTHRRITRVARYLRVSRADQDLALQDDETSSFASQRNWEIVATYEDQGVSGAKDRRPGLDRMLADARRGRFDAIVVWKSDRLFRSLKHLVVTVNDLADQGVGFASVTEPIDTASPAGKLVLHLLGSLAEFERSLIRERTSAGMQAARRRGARIGRPRARFDLDRALDMREAGASIRAIAAELGVSTPVVHAALRAAGVSKGSPARVAEPA